MECLPCIWECLPCIWAFLKQVSMGLTACLLIGVLFNYGPNALATFAGMQALWSKTC
jgi:hypothetical protein